MTTEAEAQDAFIAALNVLLDPQIAATIQTIRKMPTKPAAYVEVGVYRRLAGAPRRVGSGLGTKSFRAYTIPVADDQDDALLMASKAAGIEGVALTVGSNASTEVDFESSRPVADDNGQFSTETHWTFSV